MLMKIGKWVSSDVLLLAGVRSINVTCQVLLNFVVCVSSLVLTQAVRAGRYFWAAGPIAIAVLFESVVPVALARKTLLWLDWVCLMTFLVPLAAVKRQSIFSIPSLTNRKPGNRVTVKLSV